MLLDGVRVVLVNTRFPENVGMAVRACANMGCSELTLVTPEMWIPEKAAPLATAKGAPLLSRVKVVSSLAEAIGDCHLILATTARTGGWRKALQNPGEAACDVARSLSGGERVAIVFGNESRGLENSQIELCQRIVTIPTSGEASSLNLAQSVLILLYECAGAVRRMQRLHGEIAGHAGGGNGTFLDFGQLKLAAFAAREVPNPPRCPGLLPPPRKGKRKKERAAPPLSRERMRNASWKPSRTRFCASMCSTATTPTTFSCPGAAFSREPASDAASTRRLWGSAGRSGGKFKNNIDNYY